MSSTALSVYPHLPPTTNLLNSQQRARLVRSTRKLGAVLGTTPHLVENDTSFTLLPLGKTTSRASKRQGTIFTHEQPSLLSIASTSATSSPSASSIDLPRNIASGTQSADSPPIKPPGLCSTQRRRPRDNLPQLCLQVNSPPINTTSSHSPSSSPCASPLTPTMPVPDLTEIRRKRMAKLARHLGEKIPVELVVTPVSPSKTATIPPNHRLRKRSQSVDVTRGETKHIYENRLPVGQSQPTQEWVGEWNRSSIRDVQKELRNLKIR